MAKNRNKKKQKDGVSAMDVTSPSTTVADAPQAMDTTETTTTNAVRGVLNRKIKKGAPMRRSKNLKKMKAIEKAIARSDKTEERLQKNETKVVRTQSAKVLYE